MTRSLTTPATNPALPVSEVPAHQSSFPSQSDLSTQYSSYNLPPAPEAISSLIPVRNLPPHIPVFEPYPYSLLLLIPNSNYHFPPLLIVLPRFPIDFPI